jgi:hypothetical protein
MCKVTYQYFVDPGIFHVLDEASDNISGLINPALAKSSAQEQNNIISPANKLL